MPYNPNNNPQTIRKHMITWQLIKSLLCFRRWALNTLSETCVAISKVCLDTQRKLIFNTNNNNNNRIKERFRRERGRERDKKIKSVVKTKYQTKLYVMNETDGIDGVSDIYLLLFINNYHRYTVFSFSC